MTVRILVGDALAQLRTLDAESVQCCVTSPPYWGLRDYGTAKWEGGAAECGHKQSVSLRRDSPGGFHNSTSRGTQPSTVAVAMQYRDECKKCGAVRIDAQLGLEKTPDEYVAKMVEVFREVRRVLRKDGTLWLNIGDSYNANRGKGFDTHKDGGARKAAAATQRIDWGKPKDLVGIPWMLAFALRADGWYLRQDIIWAKPNPMPESVRDRCTKAHEYVFLVSKSERYFYDADAIAEATVREYVAGEDFGGFAKKDRLKTVRDGQDHAPSLMDARVPTSRNRRSVWQIPTAPFPEAHFATFPPDLAEICIKAGSAAGTTVLDPFGGAGTTGLVADRLHRDAILIELNEKYAAMGERRIRGDNPMFADVSVA